MMWLSSVHTAQNGDQSQTSNRTSKHKAGEVASLEYVVMDDITARPESIARSPLLILATDGKFTQSQMKVFTIST